VVRRRPRRAPRRAGRNAPARVLLGAGSADAEATVRTATGGTDDRTGELAAQRLLDAEDHRADRRRAGRTPPAGHRRADRSGRGSLGKRRGSRRLPRSHRRGARACAAVSGMSLVVLDTNVVSYLMKGGPRADAYRERLRGNDLAISFMTVAE